MLVKYNASSKRTAPDLSWHANEDKDQIIIYATIANELKFWCQEFYKANLVWT